jgi:5-methylcytosine-specific restriction endonuclease McrA
MNSVAVLNSDYQFIGTISWERSIVLLYQGKAEIVKETDRVIYNFDKTFSFIVPRIIRLITYVRSLYRNKIPYSKRNIFVRDNYTCQYCDKKLDISECTVDHVVPKVLGGKSSWSNCVCSCKKCNNIKGDKPLEHTGLKLKKEPQTPSAGDFIRLRSKTIVEKIWE